MQKETLITIGSILVVFGLFFYVSPLTSTTTDDYDIEPLQAMWLNRHHEQGERIEGYFTVLGGNEEIEFRIEDPYGVAVYDAGVVKSRHDFALATEHSGVYTLFFGNKQESGKVIFLSHQTIVTPTVLCLLIAIIGICILGYGSLGIYQKRLKPKQTTE